MKTHWISLLPLLILILVSCGPSQSAVSQPPTLPTAGGEPQGVPAQGSSSTLEASTVQLIKTPEASSMSSLPPVEDNLVNLAKQALAARLKIDLPQIVLLKTMEITWPDISAGCNSGPGQILSKGRVYGYRVWLEANGVEYLYHVGEGGQAIPCTEPDPGANNPLLMTPGGPTQDPNNKQP